MPTRACFLVVPTTTVRLVLLMKLVQTCFGIRDWPVLQIQALKASYSSGGVVFGQGMSLAQALPRP